MIKSLSRKALGLLACVWMSGAFAAQTEFYVATNGSDKNSGTEKKPFLTLERARDAVRKANRKKVGEITVYLRGGTHVRNGTFLLTQQDSGKKGNTVLYTSYPNERAVLSGGTALSGWQPHEGGIYKTVLSMDDVNAANNFHELYVDGRRADRA